MECKKCHTEGAIETDEGKLCRKCYPLYRKVVCVHGKPIMLRECKKWFREQWDEMKKDPSYAQKLKDKRS